jgi:hypothetical protein
MKQLLRGGWLKWCHPVLLCAAPAMAAAQDSVAYPALSAVLRIGEPRRVIGEELRESPALFGTIRGVAMDGQHHIYVLDASTHSVRRFGPSGEYIGGAGRSGRGPGDLSDPYSLWHDGDHTLYVVDRLNGINLFDTQGRQMVFRRRFAEGRNAMAVCKVSGHLVAAGFHEGHILHALNDDGNVTTSFGNAFRPDTDAVVQRSANTGAVVLACDEVNRRLYVSQASQGRVRAYDADGSLLWESALPGFLGSQVFRDRKGAVVTVFPKHKTEALLPVGRDHIVVQAHHKERRIAPNAVRSATRARGVEVDVGVVTYVLSAKDGRVITRQYGGPFLMARSRLGGDVAGYDDDPFPRVVTVPVFIIAR